MSLPSTGSVSWTLARLTLRRMLRTRVTWASLVVASFPVVFAGLWVAFRPEFEAWSHTFGVTLTLFAILPPLIAAGLIAEEHTSDTITYLWSRPIGRSTVLLGKLLGSVILLCGLFTVSTAAAWMTIARVQEIEQGVLLRGLFATCLGAVTFAAMAAALGSLITKQAVATAVAYVLLLDLPVGALPFSLGKLAASQHVRILATESGDELIHVIWLLGMAGFWLTLGVWRNHASELKKKG